eukprot:TRINITY_DN3478_c0_g1_i1.p1 TRINITY_DN3478_c0_g1~~TRINITY_DN3478_c0_g1_i1.p1  ORF type:complete len:200 (-),score=89.14 TRINITY_DN3478_c0_g1_i1:27-626(-)
MSGQSSVVDYGGETDIYKWNQTKEEVTVNLDLKDESITAKNIVYELTPTTLKFGVKGRPLLIDGTFPDNHRVSVSGSTWTKDGTQIDITLTKQNVGQEADKHAPHKTDPKESEWWSCLVTADADKEGGSIDTEMIDASRYLDDSLLRKVKEGKRQKKLEEEAAKKAAAAAAASGSTPQATTEASTSSSASTSDATSTPQ